MLTAGCSVYFCIQIYIKSHTLNEVLDVFGGSSIPFMHSAGSTLFRITCDYATLSIVVDFGWRGDGLEKLQFMKCLSYLTLGSSPWACGRLDSELLAQP